MKNIFKSEIFKIFLLLMCSLTILILTPILFWDRFWIPDAQHYATMVEYFRGNAKITDVAVYFRNKLLVPFIASLLPWNAYLSLMVVSTVFTLLSVLFL